MTAQPDGSRQSEAAAGTTRDVGVAHDIDVEPALEWWVRAKDAHKLDSRNLWLSTAVNDEQNRFTVNFSIPAGSGPLRFVDLIEVERQAGIVFAHSYLDVPHDAAFVLSEIALELVSGVRWPGKTGLTGTIQVSLADPAEKARSLRKATLNFGLSVHGRPSGRGSATVRFLPLKLYARFRRRRTDSELDADDESRYEHATPNTIAMNPMDPLVNDHLTDHVSGIAVAAAIDNVVTTQPGERVLRMLSLRFHDYIEHHPPAALHIDRVGDGELRGSVRQGGIPKATFSGLLSLRGEA